jgi:polo-like kinase 1
VVLTDDAKDIITKILVKDPAKRPTIDEILDHNYFQHRKIPKLLPASTLAVAPTSTYL